MPPGVGREHARSMDYLCSPPSEGPSEFGFDGVREKITDGASASSSHAADRGTREEVLHGRDCSKSSEEAVRKVKDRARDSVKSQGDRFFVRCPTEGGLPQSLPKLELTEREKDSERGLRPGWGFEGRGLSVDGKAFVRAASEGQRKARTRLSQSGPLVRKTTKELALSKKTAKELDPSKNETKGPEKPRRPRKKDLEGDGLAAHASFDFAAAAAHGPAVAFSGPLPRGSLEHWREDSSSPRGTPPRLPQRNMRQASSWMEGREKQPATWRQKARNWLQLRPSPGRIPRGGSSTPPFMSLVPHSDGALGLTLREEAEGQDPKDEGHAPTTPNTRKALFCPSSQVFLESVSTSTW